MKSPLDSAVVDDATAGRLIAMEVRFEELERARRRIAQARPGPVARAGQRDLADRRAPQE
jgi:hypothetical protein